MASEKFNVCIARKYDDGRGAEKTHFWPVGKAFLNTRPDGSRTINVKLYSRTLMVDEYVLFEDKGQERIAQALRDRPNQQELDTPEDDDIPF
jgi:hypothetical protein